MKLYIAIGDLSKQRYEIFKELEIQRVLVSFACIKGKDIDYLPGSDVLLDSGAFSAKMSGQCITVETYSTWLQQYQKKHSNITRYINLDDMDSWEKTKENQLRLESDGLKPVPVYHYGEPEEVLEDYCSRYEYVCLGGIAVPGLNSKNKTIFWEYVSEKYTNIKFHLLGMTTPEVIYKRRPFSTDSNSWTSADRFGNLAGMYKGMPAWSSILSKTDTGWEYFFSHRELFNANLRAMLEWEKLEWLDKIEEPEGDQKRLF